MFSPATRRAKPHPAAASQPSNNSPSTPIDGRRPSAASAVPNRPATGTPAPWFSRLSVLARIPTAKSTEKIEEDNEIQPVYVGEFPNVVRNAQASLFHKGSDTMLAGGLDKGTSLAWIVCGSEFFIWSHPSGAVSKKCITLEIPSSFLGDRHIRKNSMYNKWLVGFIRWDISSRNNQVMLDQCNSVGVVLCNQETHAVAYWPEINLVGLNRSPSILQTPQPKGSHLLEKDPVTLIGSNNLSENEIFNSMITLGVNGDSQECIALICQSSGVIWLYRCAPAGIHGYILVEDVLAADHGGHSSASAGYARSLIWRPSQSFSKGAPSEFFLLTDHEIQCWSINLSHNTIANKLWSHIIVGNDGDAGIRKDLAGQKQIWPLDMQVDNHGKEFFVLIATFSKDQVSSSSYIQYSLLTMQYKPNFSIESSRSHNERVLEKKAPLQTIIPKARVEVEEYLFSLRLRVGGKPSGSVIILSGDGTATVAYYWRGSTRLYQFELPWDAGKVLDASVFSSDNESEEGAWVVLTEKAGVWAIPEKSVLLGAVEPPERSLSRKGSLNGRAVVEENRSPLVSSDFIPQRVSPEKLDADDGRRATLAGMMHRTAQGEEAEALLSSLFHNFLMTNVVEGVLEKLRDKGAFQKEGETNVFARFSKSIVDTLAKHWTTTRGAEFVTSAIISSLLRDKQEKHSKYLQFLALSKCHEELSTFQRNSLLIIMEHGEKLSSIFQLRELQNILSQSRKDCLPVQTSGALSNLIQLVGERARRNTVLLMDRDNYEVFYSKVSDLEDLFYCLSHHIEYIIGSDQPFVVQMQHLCEVSNACVTLVQAAMQYRDEHKNWYPSVEGLTPWNSQPVVRSGLCSIASSMMRSLVGTQTLDIAMKSELWNQLEELTDVLLDSYTGAITAKIERGEEHHGLMEEYSRKRDELLGWLYDLAKGLTESKYQDKFQGVVNVDGKKAIFREVTEPLLLIAKRHEGYQTLWQLCYDLNDTGLLRSLMHESIGPKGGFSYFVFKQFIQTQQHSKLLRLGEEFQEELASFLKDHKDLLWLHQIYLNRFSSASETLHALALSLDASAHLMTYEESEPTETNRNQLSLADRKRLLNLSKIAAVAGKEVGFETMMTRIEAGAQILKLQEGIIKRLPADSRTEDFSRPLPPGELVEICLKAGGKELALLAFEVLTWTCSSFRRSNRSLLVECWRNAADQDAWQEIAQLSTAEGWSDELKLEYLRDTVLYKASNWCYGPEAEAYDGSFEEVLPLQKDDMAFSSLRYANSSVEGILIQHKDFPDAGKLMLTAIMLAKVKDNDMAEVEEDVAMQSA